MVQDSDKNLIPFKDLIQYKHNPSVLIQIFCSQTVKRLFY